MISLRAALPVAAVLAVALVAARWHGGEEDAPARSSTAPVATHAPAPWPQPVRPAATAPAAMRPMPLASAANLPVAPPPIGSEGYGPHIERAAEGSDPQRAWAAVQWLRACAVNDTLRQSAEVMRDKGVVPEFMTQRMVELDAEARRCQTVTALHRGLEPALTLQAMRGGVAGAAAAFAAVTPPAPLGTAERQEVVAAMRRDAASGQPDPALQAAMAPQAWDLPDTERLTYLYVYAGLQGEAAGRMARALLARGLVPFKAPPTPEQMQQAQAEAQRMLARWNVPPP